MCSAQTSKSSSYNMIYSAPNCTSSTKLNTVSDTWIINFTFIIISITIVIVIVILVIIVIVMLLLLFSPIATATAVLLGVRTPWTPPRQTWVSGVWARHCLQEFHWSRKAMAKNSIRNAVSKEEGSQAHESILQAETTAHVESGNSII